MAIIYQASQESGNLNEWHSTNASDSGCSIKAVRAADKGIPKIAGDWVVEAKVSGGGADYARTIFMHDSAGVPRWKEGTDVWYSAYFFLPSGFYSHKNSSNDIMRWDAYVNGSEDMQGGLGIKQDDTLRIMSNYPYTEPLTTSYKIPENKWTHLEVHQKLSSTNGQAINEIWVDGTKKANSTTANYKGNYSASEREVNRLRFGLVSEGDVGDANTIYFDKATISTTRVGTGGGTTEPPNPGTDESVVTITVAHPADVTVKVNFDET